eukprot:TRINITY_DN5605_c0_g2_i1.p1 TRINITY_DN5605_c0_g2~~TRINITY_DN5605_c0_g2_i1.p1  ORF type:complete len:414 (-),score=45.89 TRINITY_DN5605_c0_g2_i1:412-1620(-)
MKTKTTQHSMQFSSVYLVIIAILSVTVCWQFVDHQKLRKQSVVLVKEFGKAKLVVQEKMQAQKLEISRYAEMAKQKDRDIESLEAKLQEQSRESAEHENVAKKVKEQIQAYEATVKEEEDKIHAMEFEIDQDNIFKNQVKDALFKARDALSQMQQNIANLTTQNDSLQRINGKLKESQQMMEEENKDLRSQLKELQSLQKQFQQSKTTIVPYEYQQQQQQFSQESAQVYDVQQQQQQQQESQSTGTVTGIFRQQPRYQQQAQQQQAELQYGQVVGQVDQKRQEVHDNWHQRDYHKEGEQLVLSGNTHHEKMKLAFKNHDQAQTVLQVAKDDITAKRGGATLSDIRESMKAGGEVHEQVVTHQTFNEPATKAVGVVNSQNQQTQYKPGMQQDKLMQHEGIYQN